ncbi:MAG: hypothetical protein IT518_06620 [Burkholderiales bacterium]|nr:hypothetical protein [Burkholderiales bacterium]
MTLETDGAAPHFRGAIRLLYWLIVALAAASFAAATVPALVNGFFGVSQFQDDAFYYLVPAKNFVRSGVMSFDGVNPTNGFHPLWMAAVTLLVWVTGADAPPETHVLAVKALEKLILAAAIVACLRFAQQAIKRSEPWSLGYLFVALLLLFPLYIVFEQGMETTLLVLLFVVAANALLRGQPIRLGIALAALFLCRLDTAPLVGLPLALWMLVRGDGPRPVRVLAIVPLLIAGAAISGLNLLWTGHAVPISGAIKSSFPFPAWHGGFLREPLIIARLHGWGTFWHGINIILTGGVLLTGSVFVAVGRYEDRGKERLAMLALVGWLLLANLLLFQKWEKSIDPRYLALPMTVALLVLGSSLQALVARSPMKVGPAPSHPQAMRMALLLLAILPLFALTTLSWAGRFASSLALRQDPVRDLFREVDHVLPRDAVIAGTDVGALAFWTRRRVVNLDGVMNDFAFQSRVRDGQLRAYLREHGVSHIATPLWDRAPNHTGRPVEPMYRSLVDAKAAAGPGYECHPYYVYSYVYSAFSDRFCLSGSNEVFRRHWGKDGNVNVAYVVYALP